MVWLYVVEFQGRGVPHVHFCLWIQKSIDEMIAGNVIEASATPFREDETERRELAELIDKYQRHRQPCTDYCR